MEVAEFGYLTVKEPSPAPRLWGCTGRGAATGECLFWESGGRTASEEIGVRCVFSPRG